MKAICSGTETKSDVVQISLEQYRAVYNRTVQQIGVLQTASTCFEYPARFFSRFFFSLMHQLTLHARLFENTYLVRTRAEDNYQACGRDSRPLMTDSDKARVAHDTDTNTSASSKQSLTRKLL